MLLLMIVSVGIGELSAGVGMLKPHGSVKQRRLFAAAYLFMITGAGFTYFGH